MLYLYLELEDGKAFITPEKKPVSENLYFVCEIGEKWAPKDQTEFEHIAKEYGIENAAEFAYSVVPVFPDPTPAPEPVKEPAKRQRKAAAPAGEIAPQTIVKLNVSNVKRISAVEITPEGNMVVIGGNNGAGKSSVLDAIQMALGGKGEIPKNPIRDGEKKGVIVLELDDLIITRSITPGGSTLTVTAKDGAPYSKPQDLLDKLTGKLTFDPLEFSRLKPTAQRETLMRFVGIDFTEEDAQRKQLYDERTLRGRELDQAKALLAQAPHFPNDSSVETSIGTLAKQLTEVKEWNGKRAELEAKVKEADATLQRSRDAIAGLEQQIAALQARIENERAAMGKTEAIRASFAGAVQAMPLKDETPLVTAINNIEAVNKRAAANKAHTAAEKKVQDCNVAYDELTAAIKHLDEQKAKRLAEAQFPIPGLSFDENGVVLNGQPFAQASSAEQIRTSVAMGLALNPTIKVLLIRDGSLLNSKSLALVAEMAKNAGAQVWIEKVTDGDGKGCSVVIEDGAVKD